MNSPTHAEGFPGEGVTRILQVSDSHLSTRAPFADENWQRVVDHAHATSPDLVVHTGDVTLDGASSDADLAHARDLLDLLPVPWLTVPGNHDIGDVGDTEDPVTTARCERYEDHFGAASWSRTFGTWLLVGVDVQTLLADLASTEDLWQWLSAITSGDAPIALFVHRPVTPLDEAELDDPHRYFCEPRRTRLMNLMATRDIRLVASGHVHQWRHASIGAVSHVWAPSTWASLPDRIQPAVGTKLVGVVEHTLLPDGRATSVLVQPSGLRELVVGVDFESPY